MTLSEEGRIAVGRFNAVAVTSLLVSLAIHGAQIALGPHPLLLFGCNFSIILLLALTAMRAHRASDGEFDSGVAAETIVAFGVLSLILGLAAAIVPALELAKNGLAFDAKTLTSLGAPFVQGLAAAGLAPVVAVLLRNFSAEHGGVESTEEELKRLAHAVGRLTGELGSARTMAAALTGALSDARDATIRLGPDLTSQIDGVAQAAGRIAPALTAGAASLAGVLDQSGRDFADELNDAGARFATRLDDARARVEALGLAADGGASHLAGLSTELARVRTGAAESAELLDALAELIASVERFAAARGAEA